MLSPSSLHNAIAESEYLRLWIERSVWSRNGDADKHLDNLTRLAIDYFLTNRLSRSEKKLVGDKSLLFGPEDMREIAAIFPEARVIHILRDGRDQAVSMMHDFWNRATDQGGAHDITPEEAAKREAFFRDRKTFLGSGESIFLEERLRSVAARWRDNVGSAVRHGPDLLGDNYMEVRYEDLLERPEEELGRLFEFLGASVHEDVVKRCVESASFEMLASRERGSEDYELGWRKRRKGIAGDWKTVFTARNREVFKKEAGDLLVSLGHENGHDW